MGFFSSIRNIFSSADKGEKITPEFWDSLTEQFILADTGLTTAEMLTANLQRRASGSGSAYVSDLPPLLARELEHIFTVSLPPPAKTKPEVILVVGVNGVGKTTTIAKMARLDIKDGKKVMLAAADTFRAAAVAQLGQWAERIGAEFHSKGQDADPAAVAWEAVDRAQKEEVDVLYIDTAGRLQNKVGLMDELKKIHDVVAKKCPDAPHRTVLVVDATTGQNVLSQVKQFKEIAGINELVITKLDGTAKGGVAIAVVMEHKLPISFIGQGEGMDDLIRFNGKTFADKMLEGIV